MGVGHAGPAHQQQRQPMGQPRRGLLPGPRRQRRPLQQRRPGLLVALHRGGQRAVDPAEGGQGERLALRGAGHRQRRVGRVRQRGEAAARHAQHREVGQAGRVVDDPTGRQGGRAGDLRDAAGRVGHGEVDRALGAGERGRHRHVHDRGAVGERRARRPRLLLQEERDRLAQVDRGTAAEGDQRVDRLGKRHAGGGLHDRGGDAAAGARRRTTAPRPDPARRPASARRRLDSPRPEPITSTLRLPASLSSGRRRSTSPAPKRTCWG